MREADKTYAFDDFTVIGQVPLMEERADDFDTEKALLFCHLYRSQIIRMFGKQPKSAHLVIRNLERHDFTRASPTVAILFDPYSKPAVDYAFRVKRGRPDYWDKKSVSEITDKRPIYSSIASEALRQARTLPAAHDSSIRIAKERFSKLNKSFLKALAEVTAELYAAKQSEARMSGETPT